MKTKCIEWKGTINDKGYPMVSIKGKNFRVHRLAVILDGRKIPRGKVVDHICRNRKCINPKHLRVITDLENILIGEGVPAKNKRKDTCNNGHLFSEHGKPRLNNKKHKYCSTCAIARTTKRYYANKKNN